MSGLIDSLVPPPDDDPDMLFEINVEEIDGEWIIAVPGYRLHARSLEEAKEIVQEFLDTPGIELLEARGDFR